MRPRRPVSELRRFALRVATLLLAAGIATWATVSSAQGTLSALETDMDRVFQQCRPSVVTVIWSSERGLAGRLKLRGTTRVSSGIAVAENEVLTTASAVENAGRIWVRTSNNLQLQAYIVGVDPVSNLALLGVPGVRLPPIRYVTSRPPQEGDWVMSIGTARDNPKRITQTVGTVVYRHRDPRLALMGLTNPAYPGFGGGAVVNSRGELVGMIMGELDSESSEDAGQHPASGISFMLPAGPVRAIHAALEADGRVRYGYLGVSTRAESVDSESQPGSRVPIGARVEQVIPTSPAARLGLKRGDLIVAFEGERVENPEQLARWVAASPPGSSVALVWVRDEIQQQGRVVLSASPTTRPEWIEPRPLAEARPAGGSGAERGEPLRRDLLRTKSASTDNR